MIIEKDIKELPIDQKLRLMEAIWTDISRTSDSYESPDWHRIELEETERRRSSEEEQPIDWEEAKAKLRSRKNEV